MKFQQPTLKGLSVGLAAFFAALCIQPIHGTADSDREMRTRSRQNYDVVVGDYYTGRSPYFKGTGEPPLQLAATPAPAPAPVKPALPCSVINTGLIQMTETMPAEATLNEPFTYEFRVMATGCAADVTVIDQIPDGTEYVSSDPAASVDGNKLTWNLGNMDAGESKTLKVTVKPTKEGNLISCATVRAVPRICAQTFVGKPQLAIDKSGPEVAQLDSDVKYSIVVKNTGTSIAHNVVVTDKYPEGLGGPAEKQFPVGDLAPGQSKTIEVPLKAAQRGRFCNLATATSSNASSVQDDACTLVVKPGLKIEKTGPAETYMNKTVAYKIVASNVGDTDLTGVVVTDTAAPQTKIVSATGGVIASNTATWNIGTLKSGEKKELSISLNATTPGRYCDSAVVTSNEKLTDKSEACTLWKGLSAVLLEVVDDPDPIQVGETTTYTIEFLNQGNADLMNVNVVAIFPKETTPVSSDKGTVDGKTVKFPTVTTLAPKQKVTYHVVAKGAEIGDSRMKVILTEDQLLAPVVEEESTRVY
jgi:uncharacterized repeat protein (TIGR01451 family)